jgi:Icc-related predicted phosphoesterase
LPGWQETKQAAQHAYINAGNQDIHSSIGNAYQQIMLTGHIHPSMGNSDIHHQIAEDAYQATPADWKEYAQYRDAWEKENPDPRLTGPDPDAPELER